MKNWENCWLAILAKRWQEGAGDEGTKKGQPPLLREVSTGHLDFWTSLRNVGTHLKQCFQKEEVCLWWAQP
jgi:hypothetical protein